MNHNLRANLRPSSRTATTSLPPAGIEETGWDILLALHSDSQSNLSLQKLASIVSVPEPVLNRWLPTFEQRDLITGAQDQLTGEILAVLTRKGRELLDRYFSTTGDLQVGAHH